MIRLNKSGYLKVEVNESEFGPILNGVAMTHRNQMVKREQIQASQKKLIRDLAQHKDSTAEIAQSDDWYHSLLKHQQLPTMISGFSKTNIGGAPIDETFSKSLY